MWRLLNNASRVFRTHISNPRPSAGLRQEDETDTQSKTDVVQDRDLCIYKKCRQLFDNIKNETSCDSSSSHSDCEEETLGDQCGSTKREREAGGEESREENYRTFNHDFSHILFGSRNLLEAVTWGPAAVWSTQTDEHKKLSKLLYKVLLAVPEALNVQPGTAKFGLPKTVKTCSEKRSPLAIKDAAGSAIDEEINKCKTENAQTLESAMAEFEQASVTYTAGCESILGLKAIEEGDMDLALRHLYQSCQFGNPSACFNLGLCYQLGSGVEQDDSKAAQYYERASRLGHSMAMYNLGVLCLKEECDEGGSPTLPTEYTVERGLDLMHQAASLGLAQAQVYLGSYYMVNKEDHSKAFSYFKAASDQKDCEGHYCTGVCYEQGLGCESNECLAAKLYSLAANAEHDLATYKLAMFNQHGMGGLPKNETTAIEMYERASQLGVPEAEQRLAEIHAGHTSSHSDTDSQEKTDPSASSSSVPEVHLSVSDEDQASLVSQEKSADTQQSLSSQPVTLQRTISLSTLSLPHQNQPSFNTSQVQPYLTASNSKPPSSLPQVHKEQGLLDSVCVLMGLVQSSATFTLGHSLNDCTESLGYYRDSNTSSESDHKLFAVARAASPEGIHKSQTFSEFSMIGI